jgi:5-methylcytosine-specific restriction endonuclease McrA
LPINEFSKNVAAKDSLQGYCKVCTSAKSSYYGRKDRSDYLATYREQNKERRAEYNHRYYRKNKNRMLTYNKQHRANNPDLYRTYCNTRRAKLKQLVASYTKQEWDECKSIYNNSCAYCGRAMKKLTQDHFVPISNGGEYTKNNIIPACQKCNSSKNNHDFFDWYPKQPFYQAEREQKILDYLGYKDGVQQLSISI